MGKKSPSVPAAPDPVATAQAQGQMNVETARTNARLNRVNQITPYGNLTYQENPQAATWLADRMAQDKQAHIDQGRQWDEANARRYFGEQNPYADQWTATQTLSPSQQRQFDLSEQAQELYGQAGVRQLQALQNTLSQPIDLTNEATERRIMELGQRRLEPMLAERRAATDLQLRNQGLTPGSAAYERAIRSVDQAGNDATTSLLLNARQQALQEALTARNQPLNETAALLTGQQVQQPNFVNTALAQSAPGDLQGASATAYQGQLAAAQQKQAAQNANMGGLYGLGGAAITGAAILF